MHLKMIGARLSGIEGSVTLALGCRKPRFALRFLLLRQRLQPMVRDGRVPGNDVFLCLCGGSCGKQVKGVTRAECEGMDAIFLFHSQILSCFRP